MSNPDIFISLAYTLYVIAPAIRDELWLRAALLVNSFAFVVWGLWIDTSPVVVANALFGLVSLRQLHRAWQERRPVHLSEDAEAIYISLFDRMGRREFAQLWQIGHESANPGVITTLGEPVRELWVVIEGTANVELISGQRLERSGPTLIGEVTALSGRAAATATVTIDHGRLRYWSRSDLDALFAAKPNVEAHMLRGLSKLLAARMTDADKSRR